MKIISYNVNGIRAAIQKGFTDWVKEEDADIVCLQEVKAESHQLEIEVFIDLGYQVFWNSAQKKGYSGVAIFSKVVPNNVTYGMDHEVYDGEGRMIRLDFDSFSLLNVYVPSGTSGEIRQAYKMKWLDDFYQYIAALKVQYPKLILCGDINICHKPIDIHNPVSNKNSSGFLPEERAWVSKFLDLGFIDTFRHFHAEPHRYSWWSYRANARAKNLGWRIDYFLTTQELVENLVDADIFEQIKHSDHCPVMLKIK